MIAADAVPVSPLRNRGFIGLLLYRLLAMLSYQIVAVTARRTNWAHSSPDWRQGCLAWCRR